MKNKEVINYTEEVFEDIKHVDEEGKEYWKASELMLLLDYKKWESFHKVIKVSMISCGNSNYNVMSQFHEVREPLMGKNRSITDYYLTRYACYLIIQNADSRKESVALAKTYIAVQTRKQELMENESFDEISTRLFISSQTDTLLKKKVNPSLKDAIDTYNKVSETIESVFKNIEEREK